jgi:hypothetical protein
MFTRSLILSFAAVALSLSAQAATVRVRISDIIETPVKGILTASTDPRAEVALDNSTGAIESVRSGESALAVVAIPDGTKLPDDLNCAPFAFDVAMIVVNNINPLQQTDLHTLSLVLSATAQNGDKWSAFGLTDIWANKNILVFLPDSSNGITLQLLRSQTVGNDKLRGGFIYLTGKENADVLVREQSECLMVVRGLDVPQSGRALQISVKSGADAFTYPPSESSVFYGDYPLRLPFYIVTKKDAPESVAKLETLLMSDDAAAKLSKAGYVPVPKTERNSEK